MRKLMTIVIAILVALVVIAGGIGGYLWYDTRQQVDRLVTMAKPFAEISYSGVAISPAGSVGVNRLRIMPRFVNDAIVIGAIRLNAPNILALLNIRRQLEQGQFPEALSISFRQLELPLYGGILNTKPVSPQAVSPLDNLDALGCGPVVHFGGAEWQEMGYEKFISDSELGYRLDEAHNRLDILLDSSTQGWATLNLDIGMALNAAPKSLVELAGALTPKLAKLDLVLRDDGFIARRNNYCAAKAGKPIEVYLADHVRLVTERLRANGIHPGPGLIDAYQRFLAEGGQFVLTATPPAPISLAELQQYDPQDVIKLLGLSLKVNDKAVSDLTISWDAAKLAQILGRSSAEPAEPEAEARPTPVAPPVVVPQKSYHPIATDQLSQYVGKIAKLKTTTGAQYKGQLESVAEGMVKITIRQNGGSVTLSLRSNEITTAQVLW
ncbi:MAG TPA: hypothetical protein PKI41_04240 [Candidatus Competibacteraceae bacterium]|nr:MAG: hypothetical protein EKK71_00240 [Candidatus Competibacteraceae bacterium]HOB61312.1 hypothetical protein [Candidatus Competibacteraceae bacterium]HQA25508.1 hypothetical protein [Candidatus Competibacteraceae bacterium]HQD55587.1 hypothetical protein [Candidatus Competibacteraceae bacterium]